MLVFGPSLTQPERVFFFPDAIIMQFGAVCRHQRVKTSARNAEVQSKQKALKTVCLHCLFTGEGPISINSFFLALALHHAVAGL